MWFKKSEKEQKEKSIQSFNVTYLGGRPELSPTYGELHFFPDRFELVRLKKNLLSVPSTDLKAFSVEGKEDVSRRITATRMIAFGVFALAAPKKKVEREQYLTLTLQDESQLIFQHTNRFINEAMFKALMSTTFAKMSRDSKV